MAWKRRALAQGRWIAAALATALAVGARPDLVSAVVYTNVTASAGISHVQHPGNATGAGFFRTGGAATGDFDNDGWVDLFVTRLNARPLLYRNRGDGTFQDVAVAAGFTLGLPLNGPAWGDIDNDGDKDLYVTSSGGTRFYMYINDGAGRFTEQAVERGAAVEGAFRYGQSVTFGDYDGDGYLDIHTNDWGNDISVSTSRLLRNLGAVNPGHFEDVTAAAGLDVYRPSHHYGGGTDTFANRHSSTFTDIDRDGHPDLAIASDFKTSQLFWNNGDGTFTDGTIAAGLGSDEDGMGSTIGDFDGDGRLDWFISALVDVPGQTEDHSGNRLYRNNGDRTFADHTDLAAVRDSGWSWGTTFLDHDNDRDLDLFVTNGWSTSDQSHIYQNDNGVFTDVSGAAGVTDTGQGRGLLSLDYDNDGDLDVYIANHGAQPILYRNDGGNANDWLKIKVEGIASNRDGIGALITVDPDADVVGDEIVREVSAGSNFLSQNELTAHFGLGFGSGIIDLISVQWPSGAVQALSDVLPNQVLRLVESVVPGDYNNDSIVNAADYTVWRNTAGQSGLPHFGGADGSGNGTIGLEDYDVWKSRFGATPRGAASSAQNSSVPEPSTEFLCLIGLAATSLVRRAIRLDEAAVDTAVNGTAEAAHKAAQSVQEIPCKASQAVLAVSENYYELQAITKPCIDLPPIGIAAHEKTPALQGFTGCCVAKAGDGGDRIRTCDLEVMSLASYRAAPPRVSWVKCTCLGANLQGGSGRTRGSRGARDEEREPNPSPLTPRSSHIQQRMAHVHLQNLTLNLDCPNEHPNLVLAKRLGVRLGQVF